jgi:phosphoribosyl 1,2-cyclic phosphate phosphodiesterase
VTGVQTCALPISEHHSVAEAIQAGMELSAGTLYLTHLALHYDQPITSRELETVLSAHAGQIRLAYDGDRLEL